jgi:hypothetical protein
MHALAGVFCAHVASWLEIPTPDIFWFEEVDFVQAAEVWLQFPGAKKNPAADPLREPCDYFRWGGQSRTVYCGYTHREQPLGIMINVCQHGKDLLDTISEECFHMYQDYRHGAGWRARAGYDLVEGQAKDFVLSKDSEIRAFLDN